jgi:hypothetical protein
MLPASAVAGTNLDAWNEHCDYAEYDVEAFLAAMTDAAVWLYDRGTVMYRGYASSGELGPLESAYRETSIYRGALTGTGTDTRIGVPDRADDLKYHYAQNLAIHYLLTGDDRFREAAENVAERVSSLWTSPGYAGGADFWTERHAGFALLAYEWAAIVSDDQADQFRQLADEAVTAYIEVQETYPVGYEDPDARCFAHDADAHGEGYGYFGCSPWMSAILAEGLDLYAAERGDGQAAAAARQSIVKLGRAIARDGLEPSGKPYYWMGVGADPDEPDPYDEHWGESAFVVAMAWYHDGRRDAALRAAADQLVQQFGDNAGTPHMRSFNWQCRAAVSTPWYLSQ